MRPIFLPPAITLILSACAVAPAAVEPERAQATSIASDVEPNPDAPDPVPADAILGQWFVDSVGDMQFPAPATGIRAFVSFDDTGFLSHAAACGGGYPAFYTLDGNRVAIERREAVVYAKCGGAAGEARERALTAALDAVERWEVVGDSLLLTSQDGTVTRLSRPTEPIPELGGDWVVLTIGGTPLGSDRPAVVGFSRPFLGAGADCNGLSTEYEADESGGIRITGPLIATEMGCRADDQAEDGRLFGALGRITGWSVGNDGLLRLAGPQPLILRRPQEGELPRRDR